MYTHLLATLQAVSYTKGEVITSNYAYSNLYTTLLDLYGAAVELIRGVSPPLIYSSDRHADQSWVNKPHVSS